MIFPFFLEPSSALDSAQLFFLLCREEGGFDTSQTLFAFAEHELPVLSESGGKSYAAWDQESALETEKAL